jgi:hypothetical protein
MSDLKILIYDTEGYISPTYLESVKTAYLEKDEPFTYIHRVNKGFKDFFKNYFEYYLKEKVNKYNSVQRIYLRQLRESVL